MAKGPNHSDTGRSKQPNRSTVVTPNPSPFGGKATVNSNTRKTIPRSQVTAEMMKDPASLAKSINDANEATMSAVENANSNPFSAVYISQKVKLTHGVPANIRHNLGVDWAYCYVVHCWPSDGSHTTNIAPITLIESTTAVPGGVDRTNNCCVIPAILNSTLSSTTTMCNTITAGSGIYDVLIAAS